MELERTQVTDNCAHTFISWMVSKRILLSTVGFTCLIAFNLLYLRTHVLDPLDYRHPQALTGCLLVLLGLFLRSWSAGILRKTEVLITLGPYSIVRNPLYVGSFLMMFGFCLLMRDWLAITFVAGPMALVYWLQVKVEEDRLSKKFSENWKSYVQRTGRFIPRQIDHQIFASWTLNQWISNREYQAFFVCIGALIALHWGHLFATLV